MTTSDLLSAAASTVRVVPYSGPKMRRGRSIWAVFLDRCLQEAEEQWPLGEPRDPWATLTDMEGSR